MTHNASRNQQVQEGAGDDNGGKHTDQNAQEQGGSESNNDARAKIAAEGIKHRAGDERRDVRVPYGGPGAFPPDVDGRGEESSCSQVFFYALKDQHVSLNR